MSRYINTLDLIHSLFAYADGKKSVGQCIDETPTADVIERKVVEAAFERVKLKAWKDGTVKLEDVADILREVVEA